ncbi:MAG: rhomboid family intramembrane serine protease [bacterium]|nr:rhomboid family intramembrane serine protease [bacterium]
MLPCPRCKAPMRKWSTRAGLIWTCEQGCDGRAATIPQLRRALTKPTVDAIWAASRGAEDVSCDCPSCRRPMREVPVALPRGNVQLDVCLRCYVVWFDSGEYDWLPRVQWEEPDTKIRDPELQKQMAYFLIGHEKRTRGWREAQSQSPTPLGGPDSVPKWLLGLLGFPVEMDERPTARFPRVTYLLLLIMTVVTFGTLADLDTLVRRYGFLPEDPLRMGGLTTITSFFLHGDWFHVIGNGYFLWLFGRNSEDVLGTGRFLLLVVLSALVGDVAFALTVADPSVPAIGASGGVSGVLAYYAFRFPQIRIGFTVFYTYWIRLSAAMWFLLWASLQVIGATRSMGNIAYAAHLGGAAIGVLFWWIGRKQRSASYERAAGD